MTYKNRVVRIKKIFVIGAIISIIAFISFVACRFYVSFNLDALSKMEVYKLLKLGNRLFYWGLFVSMSVIFYAIGGLFENRLIRHLVFYQISITFALSFVFFLMNAILDKDFNNVIPVTTLAVALIFSLCLYLFSFLKS